MLCHAVEGVGHVVTSAEAIPLSEGTATRAKWRSVALPSEHGGWGLTLEPVLLGLLVVPSVTGVALGAAAFVAFFLRTPLKLAVIDVRRRRWLDRSRLAVRIAAGEAVLLAGLVGVAVWTAGWSWLAPVAVAAPLVGIEFWFDVRSRGRRLLPELCGAAGIAAVAAAIALAGGSAVRLAAGMWLVLAARALGAIPFVRVQIVRLRRGACATAASDIVQGVAVAIGAVAVGLDRRLSAGLVGLGALAALQLVWVRRPPVVPRLLGLRQMALGLGLVMMTAAGALAW